MDKELGRGGEIHMTADEKLAWVFSDEILDLIDNRDEFTRSDLQGVVMATVNRFIIEARKTKPDSKNK